MLIFFSALTVLSFAFFFLCVGFGHIDREDTIGAALAGAVTLGFAAFTFAFAVRV